MASNQIKLRWCISGELTIQHTAKTDVAALEKTVVEQLRSKLQGLADVIDPAASFVNVDEDITEYEVPETAVDRVIVHSVIETDVTP